MQTVLVVEDKDSMAQMLKETLEAEGFAAVTAKDGDEGVARLADGGYDLVLTDLRLPGRDGMEVLRASKEQNPLRPVIVMTAHGSVEAAVAAMKEGAFDFITKPFDVDHLLMLIRRALENRRLMTENLLLKEEFSSRVGLPAIIGKSDKIVAVARNIQKAAPTRTTILLTGESGTGKELFARAIHNLSGRNDYPFVAINCAAIPGSLMESELFGHEKGSFTGAHARKLGKFELANRGTVFLDEVGELDLELQAKLLRVIQEGEIERVGGTKTIKIDVRLVAASNKDLEREVAAGGFREDLYYRLSVFPIRIPPLRERTEDIPLLAEYFLKKYCADLKAGVEGISPEALGILAGYEWKGNVRELENAIERAIILCDGKVIAPEHIFPGPIPGPQEAINAFASGSLDEVGKRALRAAESERIRRALAEASGNKTRAAEALRVSYKTLLTKIKDYGID
ncbi:MAG: sigma-54 dependent transcriptional regulator [Thermodesulfovibrionales bacterium]